MRLERELMRGAGPTAVLRLLADRTMYGYELAEALGRIGDGVLAMGQSTLYPMLYNLEGKGHVRAEWRTADTGRRRKYYALTEDGIAHLAEHRRQWQQLFGALADLGLVAPTAEVVE